MKLIEKRKFSTLNEASCTKVFNAGLVIDIGSRLK